MGSFSWNVSISDRSHRVAVAEEARNSRRPRADRLPTGARECARIVERTRI